jgi:two-component system, NarL family, invasion response regulator UvrY
LLVDGKSAADIALTLNLSQKTVMNMHYIVKRKLGVTSDIELMRLAVRLNIVDLLELTGANCP